MSRRLASLGDVPAGIQAPSYAPEAHGVGIVHLGVGAFHRAHQAPATDDALAAGGGDWRIQGVSLKRPDAAAQLNPQRGLYTLLVRGPAAAEARVIGSLNGVVTAPADPAVVLTRLADPKVRIVSLTVTEKAYGLHSASGGLDLDHPAVRHDLATPTLPIGPLGYLVEGLARRRAAGITPFTSLCCDNLPNNGAVLRRLVLELAERREPALARWIEAEAAFPSTMVDRITPASTTQTYADAARLLGCRDEAAVETEPFTQWVIEDRFAAGRPAWEAGGALFVADVRAYERMKLRMLNGTHSLLAYLGVRAGLAHVRDVMAVPQLAAVVRRHVAAAAATLDPVPGIDLDRYAADLCARFANPAIAHRTAQIATDGTQKLPQRLLEPALQAEAVGTPITTFALAVAAWAACATGFDEAGRSAEVVDPHAAALAAAVEGVAWDGPAMLRALEGAVPGVFPPALLASERWRSAVEASLTRLLRGTVRDAVAFLDSG